MEFKDQIRQLRTDRGLTQDDLASNLNVTRQTVSNWENGKNYPDITTLRKISKLYGVSLDEMLNGDQHLANDAQKTFRLLPAIALMGAYIIYLGLSWVYFWLEKGRTPVITTIVFTVITIFNGAGVYAMQQLAQQVNGLSVKASNHFSFKITASSKSYVGEFYLATAISIVIAVVVRNIRIANLAANIIAYLIGAYVVVGGVILTGSVLILMRDLRKDKAEVK